MCHVIPALSIMENVHREETLHNELKSADENRLEVVPYVSHWLWQHLHSASVGGSHKKVAYSLRSSRE